MRETFAVWDSLGNAENHLCMLPGCIAPSGAALVIFSQVISANEPISLYIVSELKIHQWKTRQTVFLKKKKKKGR